VKEYDFTLKFNLTNPQANPQEYVDRLYASGCDDALIGIGKHGSISINFIRSAESAYIAISSAILDVRTAIPQVTLIEVTPDLVGLTDVAKILGCTRQNVRNLIFDRVASALPNRNFRSPSPVYEGTPSLWHLVEILTWLRDEKMYVIDDEILEIAKINMEINTACCWQRLTPEHQEQIEALVA
jgi:hypothetical protein